MVRAGAVPERTIARGERAAGHWSAASPQARSPGEAGSGGEPHGCREGLRREKPGTASKPGFGSPAPTGAEPASTCGAPPSGAVRRSAGPYFQLPRPAALKSNPRRTVRQGPSPIRTEGTSWPPDSGVPGRDSKPRAKRSRQGFPPAVSDARFPRPGRCSNRSESGCRRRTGPTRRPVRC